MVVIDDDDIQLTAQKFQEPREDKIVDAESNWKDFLSVLGRFKIVWLMEEIDGCDIHGSIGPCQVFTPKNWISWNHYVLPIICLVLYQLKFSFSKKDFHSRHTLVRLLDKCVYNADLSLSDYSWHSFRRGAAVFAFELGLADSAVQLLGDWSSSAFKNYLEFSFMRKVTIAKQISASFDEKMKHVIKSCCQWLV